MRGAVAFQRLVAVGLCGGLAPALVEVIAAPRTTAGALTRVCSLLLVLSAGALAGLLCALLAGLLISLLYPGGIEGLGDALRVFLKQGLVNSRDSDTIRRLLVNQVSWDLALSLFAATYFLIARKIVASFNNLTLMAVLLTVVALGTMLLSGGIAALVRRPLQRFVNSRRQRREVRPLWVALLPTASLLALLFAVVPVIALQQGLLVEYYWLAQLAASLVLMPVFFGLFILPGSFPGWRVWGTSAAAVSIAFFVLGNTRIGRIDGEHSTMLSGFMLHGARAVTDFDRDGFSSLFGGTDCAPFDGDTNAATEEIPSNGRDENCNRLDGPGVQFVGVAPEYVLPSTVPRRPDVLLVTLDAVRADHLKSYGYGVQTSPNIDALARRSVLFRRAYSAGPSTTSSIPSIVTGRNLYNVGLSDLAGTTSLRKMTEENLTMAEYFKSQGYHTQAVVSHRYFDEKHNWGQGFDGWHIPVRARDEIVSSPGVLEKALALLKEHRREGGENPLFLWTHFYDPHLDYVRHEEAPFATETLLQAYDSEIWYTDRHVGQLLEEALRGAYSQQTVVVVTADHGEEFGEHGSSGRHRTVYRECLHVPLMFFVPGLPPGFVEEPVSLIDLAPTLAELSGGAVPGAMLGTSLVPGLVLGNMKHRGPVFAEFAWRSKTPPIHYQTVIVDEGQFIREVYSGREEYFDLSTDALEQTNLLLTRPEDAAELSVMLDRFADFTTVLAPDSTRTRYRPWQRCANKRLSVTPCP